VSEQIPIEAGEAVNDLLNPFDGRLVIGIGSDGNPQFGEVRADWFVGDFGPTDVRTEVANELPSLGIFELAQILAGAGRDAAHRIDGGTRLLDEVHEEIGFLKAREKLLAEASGGDAGE